MLKVPDMPLESFRKVRYIYIEKVGKYRLETILQTLEANISKHMLFDNWYT